MYMVKEICLPETLQEAYDVVMAKRTNALLGGCTFLRLGRKSIQTGVDLGKLQLNQIEINEQSIVLGASVTYYDIETNEFLQRFANGVIAKAIQGIVGTQFRRSVTVGASVFSKYGFSDFIPALLALKAEVELFGQGRMSLEAFLQRPYQKDILVRIIIPRQPKVRASYQCVRLNATDFPILNVVVSRVGKEVTVVVGARPAVAKIAHRVSEQLSATDLNDTEAVKAIVADLATELSYQDNMRATAEYRKAMAQVLALRALKEVQ